MVVEAETSDIVIAATSCRSLGRLVSSATNGITGVKIIALAAPTITDRIRMLTGWVKMLNNVADTR